MTQPTTFAYDEKHERANVLTHGLAFVVFLILVPLLIHKARTHSDLILTGTVTFGIGILLMYLISTWYHKTRDVLKRHRLRVLDHISIYLLIGTSYTAYIFRYYSTDDGMYFLGIHWLIIIFGIFFKLFYTGAFEFISTALYLVLGWMVIFRFSAITAGMSQATLYMVVAGGLSYTLGVVFYAADGKIPYNHAIWHLFVIMGTSLHYAAFYIGL